MEGNSEHIEDPKDDATNIESMTQKGDDNDNLVKTVGEIETDRSSEPGENKENKHESAVKNEASQLPDVFAHEATQSATQPDLFSYKMKPLRGVQPFNLSSPDTKGCKPSPESRTPTQDRRGTPKGALATPAEVSPESANQLVEMAGRGGVRYITGPVFNAENLTTLEEHMRFRYRAGASANYGGPLYISEDVHVPCQACGGPLDPIQRVPVGPHFFHPHCVRCALCARTSPTEPFQAVHGAPVCGACLAKGFAHCVGRERGRGRRGGRASAASARPGEDSLPALNRAFLKGATAPSLSIVPLHNRRNTGRRSFALMQRQQYYTQSDLNLISSKELMNIPTQRSSRRSVKGNGPKGGVALLSTTTRASTGLESEFPRLAG